MATSPRRATLFANVALLLATVSSTATGQTASNTLRGSTVRREDTDIAHSNVVGRKLSMERCLQDEIIAERSQIGLECICKSKADQGIVMVCSDQCAFCNDDQSVCGIKSTETLYDSDNGSRVGIGLVFEYLKPGSAMLDRMAPDLINMAHVVTEKENSEQVESPVVVLGIEEVDCEEDEESQQLTSCDTCNVYLGGKPCESCDLIECGEEGSGVFAPVMDCTNVQPVSDDMYFVARPCSQGFHRKTDDSSYTAAMNLFCL